MNFIVPLVLLFVVCILLFFLFKNNSEKSKNKLTPTQQPSQSPSPSPKVTNAKTDVKIDNSLEVYLTRDARARPTSYNPTRGPSIPAATIHVTPGLTTLVATTPAATKQPSFFDLIIIFLGGSSEREMPQTGVSPSHTGSPSQTFFKFTPEGTSIMTKFPMDSSMSTPSPYPMDSSMSTPSPYPTDMSMNTSSPEPTGSSTQGLSTFTGSFIMKEGFESLKDVTTNKIYDLTDTNEIYNREGKVDSGVHDSTDYGKELKLLKDKFNTLKLQTPPKCSQPVKCIADFGTNVGEDLCCGQTGVLQNTKYVCPANKPKCGNFKCGSTFGQCS